MPVFLNPVIFEIYHVGLKIIRFTKSVHL